MVRKYGVKIIYPANAGNSAVRSFLSILGLQMYAEKHFSGDEEQTKREYTRIWKAMKDGCEGHCGYCEQKAAELHRDHIIPMNKIACGLDHPGNWMPCCSRCNNLEKKQKDWRSFLEIKYASDPSKLIEITNKIIAHQRKYEYPLENNEQIRTAAEELYKEVTIAVGRNLKLIGRGRRKKKKDIRVTF